MDIYEIRRVRFSQLIDEVYGGNTARLAALLDKNPSQLYRWKSGEEKSRQNMREDMARQIEQVSGKPRWWLDYNPSEPDPITMHRLMADAIRSTRDWDLLSDQDKNQVYEHVLVDIQSGKTPAEFNKIQTELRRLINLKTST